MTLSITVRILDSAGALVLNPTLAAGYKLTGLSEGGRVFRRAIAESRFVDGSVLTAATLDVSIANAAWIVGGTTDAQVQTRTETLRVALEQFTFRFEVTIAGVVETWDCWCADTSKGDSGQVEPELLWAKQQRFTASVPRQPRPL